MLINIKFLRSMSRVVYLCGRSCLTKFQPNRWSQFCAIAPDDQYSAVRSRWIESGLPCRQGRPCNKFMEAAVKVRNSLYGTWSRLQRSATACTVQVASNQAFFRPLYPAAVLFSTSSVKRPCTRSIFFFLFFDKAY